MTSQDPPVRLDPEPLSEQARRGERRWPMALAVLAAGGLRAALPPQLRDGDARWAFGAVVIVLLAVLIVGLMFASGYAAIEHLGESVFFANNQPANTQTFQYFSFTTLTTLGYGDFTALQNGGRAVAVLEALTGQVFLATLVARLVAAYRTPGPPEPTGQGRLPEDVDGPGDDEDRD